MKKTVRKSDCPIHYAMELFGDRWTLLIIRDLMFKNKHSYGEFLLSDEKIATNILADRLALLEREKIISTSKDMRHKQKIIYRLTPKGIDLLPVLVELIMWSAKYDKQTAADKKFVKNVKQHKAAVLAAITDELSGA